MIVCRYLFVILISITLVHCQNDFEYESSNSDNKHDANDADHTSEITGDYSAIKESIENEEGNKNDHHHGDAVVHTTTEKHEGNIKETSAVEDQTVESNTSNEAVLLADAIKVNDKNKNDENNLNSNVALRDGSVIEDENEDENEEQKSKNNNDNNESSAVTTQNIDLNKAEENDNDTDKNKLNYSSDYHLPINDAKIVNDDNLKLKGDKKNSLTGSTTVIIDSGNAYNLDNNKPDNDLSQNASFKIVNQNDNNKEINDNTEKIKTASPSNILDRLITSTKDSHNSKKKVNGEYEDDNKRQNVENSPSKRTNKTNIIIIVCSSVGGIILIALLVLLIIVIKNHRKRPKSSRSRKNKPIYTAVSQSDKP